MVKKEVGIGLIGYAFMGKTHSNAFRQVDKFFDDLEVKPVMRAICGRNEENVKRAADTFGWQSLHPSGGKTRSFGWRAQHFLCRKWKNGIIQSVNAKSEGI